MRSILESSASTDNNLLDLCLDVIYNNNMKAFGLHQLVLLYIEWESKRREGEDNDEKAMLKRDARRCFRMTLMLLKRII